MGGFDELHKQLALVGADGERMWLALTQGVGANSPDQAMSVIRQINGLLNKMHDDAEAAALALTHVGGSDLTWQELEQTAKDLGIDVTKLGTAFDKLKLDDVGKKLADAFGQFKKAGTDNLVVLRGMQDEVNAWLRDVEKAGIKIPAYMKPILQAMADAGELTDAAGNKIENLDGYEFEGTLEGGLDRVATGLGDVESAVRDLIAVLTGEVPGAFAGLTRETDKWVLDTKDSVNEVARHIQTQLGGGFDVQRPDLRCLRTRAAGSGRV
jgi:hypothetical protein